MHTIVVEEAEFETIYWLLKYCYANWLSFKQQDDPRAAVEGVGGGWSARWLSSRENEWDWKTFHKSGSADDSSFDSRSAASVDGLIPGRLSRSSSRISGDHDLGAPPNPTPHPSSVPARVSNAKTVQVSTGASASSSRPGATPRRATTNAPGVGVSTSGASSSTGRSKPMPVPVTTSGYAASSHYPNSPRLPRNSSTPDPHPHPTPAPPPASALAMYQVAHRYSMGSLAAHALEHIMSTLAPENCFAMLMASYTWDELHALVEDYVIEKWDEVSVSEEFERCCGEVAAGECVVPFSVVASVDADAMTHFTDGVLMEGRRLCRCSGGYDHQLRLRHRMNGVKFYDAYRCTIGIHVYRYYLRIT